MLKIQTQKILQAEMDRKDFLKATGFALIGLVGVTAAAKRLNVFSDTLVAHTTKPSLQSSSSSRAYGRSAYGA